MGFLLGLMLGQSHSGGDNCCCRAAQHVWKVAEKAQLTAAIAQADADTKAILLMIFAGMIALAGLAAWLQTEGWLDWIPGPMPMFTTSIVYPFPPPWALDLSALSDAQLAALATAQRAPEDGQ